MARIPSITLDPKPTSNYDLSYVNRMTMSPGTLNVVYHQLCQPGSTYAVEPRHLVQSMPMKTPMLGRMALQLDWFFVPIRLYCKDMQINDLNLAPNQTDFALAKYTPAPAFASSVAGRERLAPVGGNLEPSVATWFKHYHVRETSLLNQIDLPYGWIQTTHTNANAKSFNATMLIGYYDIFRNYYAYNQEPYFYLFRNKELGAADSSNPYMYDPRTISNDSGIMQWDLQALNVLFAVGNGLTHTNSDGHVLYSPSTYNALGQFIYENLANGMCPNSGLLLRTYKSDYFTQWLSKSQIDDVVGNQSLMRVTTVNGHQGITINQFRTANKLTKRSEAIAVSGGHYDDIIQVDFGVSTNQHLNIPEFLGSSTTYIDYQNIQQQTAGDTAYEPGEGLYPLGAQAGKGVSYSGNESVFINPSEWGYLMGIASMVPLPDYYQGVHKHASVLNYSDLHSPRLDNLGFQALTESEYYAIPQMILSSADTAYVANYDENDPYTKGVSYQPAWMEYMTRTNELHGHMCSDLRFWTFGRDMTHGALDLDNLDDDLGLPNVSLAPVGYATPSVYVFPSDYNLPFYDADKDSHNYIVQFAFDVFAEQQVSKRLMPNAQ